ncbi:MAG: alpha/beta hydrolase [Acidobacteriota bacterium]
MGAFRSLKPNPVARGGQALRTGTSWLLAALLCSPAAAGAWAQSIVAKVPAKVDPKARYLFYLHGRIVQDQQNARPRHERFGYYEYEKILRAFADRGFTVISEIRARDATVDAYARKVADQVRTLIRAGVPSHRITVLGASMGGAMALFASGYLQSPGVNFVILAGCSQSVFASLDQQGLRVSGNVLSVTENSDESVEPCEGFLKARPSKTIGSTRSIRLTTGLAHGFLYRPLSEWVNPVIAWADEMAAAK